jgi:hypothetical protein
VANAPSLELQITVVRDRLGARLTELQRRVTHARTIMSPRTYFDNPWVRAGLGVAVGYLLGSPGRSAADAAQRGRDQPEGLLRAMVRTGLMTLAGSMIRRAMNDSPPPSTALH